MTALSTNAFAVTGFATNTLVPALHSKILGSKILRTFAALAVLALCAASTPDGARAGVSLTQPEPIAVFDISVDWQTGYAISGFDPVAYFTQGRAIQGSSDFEAMWKGTVWAFRSSGNRDAFLTDPELYAPVFGGHDPEMATQGFVAAGNPIHWTIRNGRLHLFRDAETHSAYLQR